MNKQRYAIIGAGALGGLYGAMLARQGFEVHFLLHSDFDHVREHGLKVDSIWGDMHLRDLHVHASPDTMPPCDVSLIGLKTTQNHLLADLLPAPTRQGGVVLVLQNGLNVEADCSAIVGENRVFGGCCQECCDWQSDLRRLELGRRSDRILGQPRPGALAKTDVEYSLQQSVGDSKRIDKTDHGRSKRMCVGRSGYPRGSRRGSSVWRRDPRRHYRENARKHAKDGAVRQQHAAGLPPHANDGSRSNLGQPAAKESGYEMSRVETLYHQLSYIDQTNS